MSLSGAPKSYPNMQLEVDTFVDTMKVSGMTHIDVVFDPEYLRVDGPEGDDLRLWTFQNIDGGKYIFNILNTDLMEQEKITISIDDKRFNPAGSNVRKKEMKLGAWEPPS